jgi:hypothetical protein
MSNTTKLVAIIVVVVFTSALTSYATNILFLDNAQPVSQNTSSSTPQPTQETSEASTKIHADSFNVSFAAQDSSSYVMVYSDMPMDDLTIALKYTCTNGTTLRKEIVYGDYNPTWNPGYAVQPGEIPYQEYRIPDYIIKATSTTKWNPNGYWVFDIYPQVEILEVYGYS